MARKDIINNYISIQAQYFEMLNDVKDLEEARKLGHLTDEQYEEAMKSVAKLKENYETWSYVILLLNEPNRIDKKKKFKRQHRVVYDYLSNRNDLYIKNENDDVLKELKKLIKETK